MAINKKDYSLYGPFKLWTIENFPFIEADFDAITNYQLYSKIVEQMRKLCENQTKLQQSQNEVIDAFNNLEKYVEDYFADLDVQEEIDNKLDEMAESGQLTDIIAQYLGLAGVLAFNTIADLSDAENITNGSICYVLGDETYNDGKGAFYKVRTVTSGDTVDGFNIVALDVSDTLIAERMPNYYINEINTNIGTLSNLQTTNKNNLVSAINEIYDDINKTEKIVMFGDSYARGSLGGGNVTTSWCERVAIMMGKENDYYSDGVSGGAFYNDTLKDGFDTFIATIPTNQKNNVSKVIIGAGANDFVISSSTTNISTNIKSVVNTAKTNFPNAKIYVCFIGYKNIMSDLYAGIRSTLLNDVIKNYAKCTEVGALFAGNIGYILHDSSLISSTDGTHPTEDGYNEISKAIYNFVECGNSFLNPLAGNVTITASEHFTLNQSNFVYMNNEITSWNSPEFTVTHDTSFSTNNVGVIQIGTFENPKFIRPFASTSLIASGSALVTFSDNTTDTMSMNLRIGYTGQAYLVFDKQVTNIKSVRCRGLIGCMPTVLY